MKTMKNKTLLSLMLVFAVAFSAFAFSLSGKNSQKVLAASPFEGDEVAFSTTKIQFDVTPDTYDFFTFEYKFDTNDSSNELSVYLMDGNSTKYYGYYYFKQDGTFYHPNGRSAGISTNVVDGWIRVLFTVADLQDRKGDANGANKPANLMRFWAKATSGSGLVRNASFYFGVAETAFDGSKVVKISPETGDEFDYVSFEYKFDTANESNNLHIALVNSADKWLYGMFDLNDEGCSDAGVTTEVLEDGYVKATINTAKANKYSGSRDDWNIANIYIYKTANGTSGSGKIRNEMFYFAEPETIEMIEGASVRLSEPYGIRFRATLSESIATNGDATFGMTIIPYDWVVNYSSYVEEAGGDYIAVLDQAGVNYRKFECTPLEDGGEYYIQASLTNIKETNLTREFIGIAWFEKAGVKTYAFNAACARSIRTVATKALLYENDGAYEDTYTSDQRNYLFSQTKRYSLADTSDTLTIDFGEANKGEDVIEFYYRKNTDGVVRFAVIEESFSDYYGYFESDDKYVTNFSRSAGVQIIPVGTSWSYDGDDTDEIKDTNSIWYKVIIDPSSLQKVEGDPSGQEIFKTLYFKNCTATFDIIGVNVRAKTVEDSAYYLKGKNRNNQSNNISEIPSLTLTDKDYLTFYIKQVSSVGGNVLKLRLRGLEGGVGTFDFNNGTISGKAYAEMTAVTEGDYAGWYRVTYNLNDLGSRSSITNIYFGNTYGEYLIGGFSAS